MHIELRIGDLTKITDVDGIVNAANTSLLGGGGVDGAIHRAGGKAILEACQQIRARQGGCKVGEAVITEAGNLPVKYIIHTVGPRWNGGTHGEADKLQVAYENTLLVAEQYAIQSLAFPNISTGIYHFPKQQAAEIVLRVMRQHALKKNKSLQKVVLMCFDQENYDIYQALLSEDRTSIK